MKNKIGRLLFKKVFIWYLAIAVFLSLVQIAVEYNNQKNILHSSLESIANTFKTPLTNAVWNLDEHQILDSSHSIVSMYNIIGISIIDSDGTIISQSGSVQSFEKKYVNYMYDKEEVFFKNNLIKKSFQLLNTEAPSEVLATVSIYSSDNIIFEKMKDQVYIIIVNAMLKSLALLALFLFFTNKLITTPLQKLINAVNKTNKEHYAQVSMDALACGPDTELPLLFKSFNSMQERVEEEIEKNRAFEKLFEHSTDALAIIEDGIIVECNRSAMRMMRTRDKSKIIGYKPGELSPGFQINGERSSKKSERLINLTVTEGTQQFEWLHRAANHKKYWFEITLTPVFLKDHNVVYATLRDITLRKKAQTAVLAHKNRLHRLANNDPLTGLPNRMYFSEQLERAILKAKRHETKLAVLFIDLDRFKPINDSLGHVVGDRVLQEVATRLRDNIREEDTLARLGGDEFVVLMENVAKESDPSILAQKILESLIEPIYIDNHILYVSSSIGISLYPKDDDSVHNLIKYADAAMYKAKAEGRNNYQFYSSDLTEVALLRVSLEAELHEALKNEDFIVYYQPQVHTDNGTLIGMEALVRWNSNLDEIISPSKFISLAEETGLIVDIDKFVMRTAIKQLVEWYEAGLNPGILSLNITMKQLQDKNCIPTLDMLLKEARCKPEWITFEITENLIMSHPEQVIETLDNLHSMGVKIAIDDFGTGYSSLSYLKRLPIDKLKIDKSFITSLPNDEEGTGIVKAIIDLSKSMHIDVLAEGVETEEQKKFLVEHGCKNIQGYLYAKPMAAEMIEEMLKDKKEADKKTKRISMPFL